MAELITENLIIYQTVNDDNSSEIAMTAQTEPKDGESTSLAVFVAQAILSLFEDGTILDRVKTMIDVADVEAFEMREVSA